MFAKVLTEMRVCVRAGRLAMSVHAVEEMHADGLTLDDLKECLLTGQVVERQFDDSFSEYKYIVEGSTLTFDEIIHVVAKLGKHNTVIITTYRVE